MDIKYINPFLEATFSVLKQFGMADVKRGRLLKKEKMQVDLDITSVISTVGQVRGNIALSMSESTAKGIVSTMMMGMPVEAIDEIAISAIGEFTNMITGSAAVIFSQNELFVDATPPSVISAQDVFFIISSVETLAIDIETPHGKIEMNIGLEM